MSSTKKLVIGCVALVAALFAYRGFNETPTTVSRTPTSSASDAHTAAPRELEAFEPALESDTKSVERIPGGVPATDTADTASEPAETCFRGRLLDPAGAPLPGPLGPIVDLTDAEGRRTRSGARNMGAFEFLSLAYGRYWVEARADGCLSTTDVIELDAQHAQLRKDYTLAPAPILKIRVVTPEGANLFDEDLEIEGRPALVAVATRERPGPWFDDVAGSLGYPFGIGRFLQSGPRVEALPEGYLGILMLDQPLPAFVSLANFQHVLQTQVVKPGDEVVTFVLSRDELAASMATIRMEVVDAATLAPLSGADAMLWGGAFMDRGQESDSNGRIVFASREPGAFYLHVGAEGHEEYRAHIRADSGLTDLGRIALEKALEVEIKVVDSSGAPRNLNFELGTYDPLTGTMSLQERLSYACTGAGNLKVFGLGRHVYVLRTPNHDGASEKVRDDSKWVSGNVLLDLRSSSAPSSFVITLTRATRVMLLAQGEPAEGLGFRVTDEQGLELVSGRFYGNGPRPLTLPQGGYRVAQLDSSGKVLAEQSVAVGALPLTVALSR